MNDKTLALQLLALGVSMLGNKGFAPVATEVNVNATVRPAKAVRGTTCKPVAKAPAKPNFNREPDGVKIIVDRPRRENYVSQAKFAHDMANYRMLVDQAKKCENIKTRIPAEIPAEVHNNRRDWYRDNGVPTAPQMPQMPPMPQHCICFPAQEEWCDGWGW